MVFGFACASLVKSERMEPSAPGAAGSETGCADC